MAYWPDDIDEKKLVTPGAKTFFPPRLYYRDDGMLVIPRQLFCDEYFTYNPGEHVVFGGPSKHGKTQLAFDLLGTVATPDAPAYVAVSKPTDETTETRGKELEFRFVDNWPPQRKIKELLGDRPSGYIIWPKFGNIDTDMENAAQITARLINDRYTASARDKKHKAAGILVMDDTMVKAKVMGLDQQMVTILAQAGGMKLGLWVFVQKPTDSGRTTLWAYENGDHYFFTKGGDSRMQKRYSEIAGDKGDVVIDIVPTLQRYQFLYYHDDDICIIDAV